MRVLFTSFGARSHVYNQVPLAWALHTAGHQVCLVSQADMAEVLAGTGLDHVVVGPRSGGELDAAGSGAFFENLEFDFTLHRTADMTLEHLQGVFAVFGGLVFPYSASDAVLDDVVRFARHWRPDLVVWDPYTFFGPIAATACGAAHARLLIGLDFIARMRSVFLDLTAQQPAELRDDPMEEWLTWALDRFGGKFDEQIVTGQWTIDAMPESMRLPVEMDYRSMRYVPYNGTAAIPDWVHEPPERPRVCVTFGVSNRDSGVDNSDLLTSSLDAVSTLDVDVVATLSSDQLTSVRSIPDNVRVAEYVPLHTLLPSCSAVVHHGGIGTFSAARIYGIPQLVVDSRPGNFPDPGFMGTYLSAAGAGLGLAKAEISPESLRDSIQLLMDDQRYATGAANLRAEALATPSPNEIVPTLERLTAQHRQVI